MTKKFARYIFATLATSSICFATAHINEAVETDLANTETLSQAFGHFISQNIKQTEMPLNIEAIIQGIHDDQAGKPSPLSEEEYEQAMVQLQQDVFEKIAERNLAQAESFLKNNLLEESVKEIVEGELQYTILKEGMSDQVISKTSTPLVHYTGKFADGTIFSSSYEIGNPIPLELSQSIPGFSMGLEGACQGECRRLFIHPNLAYGKTDILPPNTLLIFDFEIIETDFTVPDTTDTE